MLFLTGKKGVGYPLALSFGIFTAKRNLEGKFEISRSLDKIEVINDEGKVVHSKNFNKRRVSLNLFKKKINRTLNASQVNLKEAKPVDNSQTITPKAEIK